MLIRLRTHGMLSGRTMFVQCLPGGSFNLLYPNFNRSSQRIAAEQRQPESKQYCKEFYAQHGDSISKITDCVKHLQRN